MSAMAIGTIVFVCIFGGSLLGMLLRSRLPESHLSPDSKDLMKLAMGVLGTMSALVLALLINSAKGTFDTQRGEVTRMAADFVELDRVLARYGPQTRDARGLLRHTLITGIDEIWPKDRYQAAHWDSTAARASANRFMENVQQLKPGDDYQRSLEAQAMQISADLAATHSLLLEQTQGSIPMPFLLILVFWLAVIFIGFGLFAPANLTVAGALLLSSLSIATAIFLVLELDRPFEGFMRISDTPMRNAVVYLGK
jgi:hypothetical protein